MTVGPGQTLSSIVRGFGVEPDAIRLISRQNNAHWRVRAGRRLYVLRRYGISTETDGDVAWELAAVDLLARAGVPVPRLLGGAREVDGATYMLMPRLGGRARREAVSDAAYRRLGAFLGEFHLATANLPAMAQRPGWDSFVEGAAPSEGGVPKREALLIGLARTDAGMAGRFAEAASDLEARDLPAVFAGHPRRLVHGDFTPWNVRVRGGQVTGVIDFELTHIDVGAVDVAMTRRGYHDPVVEGYLTRAPLTDLELAHLDGLRLGGILGDLWRLLERRLGKGADGADLTRGLGWYVEQVDKTRPYRS